MARSFYLRLMGLFPAFPFECLPFSVTLHFDGKLFTFPFPFPFKSFS